MSQTTETETAGWPQAWALALGDASLEDASSEAIFGRGKAYARSGAVDVLDEDPMPEPAIRAQVTGSEVYATEVWIEDDAIAGSCDCPHAQDGWFCKHQVAVALVWRERLASAPGSKSLTASAGTLPAAKRPRTKKDRHQALRDFLCGQDPATLADKLLDLANRDHDTSRALYQWQKLSEAKGKTVDLKPLVEEVLSPGRGFISWNEAFSYAQRAEAAVPLLQRARETSPATAVAICVDALRQVWKVLEQADDSNGEIGEVCEAIGNELMQAVRGAAPLPASFGDTYLQLQLDEPFGCFDAEAVEAGMGKAALTRYRQVLADRWSSAKQAVQALRAAHAAKVAARKGRPLAYESFNEREMRLSTIEPLHLAQLKQMGAYEDVLAILREDLSRAYGHSQVVAFLESIGRFDEAFEQARCGHDAFPDDRRLQDDLLRCFEREGLTREVLMLRRSQFDQQPSLAAYQHVIRAGQAAGEDADALRQDLLEALQLREQETLEGRLAGQSFQSTAWQRPRPGVAVRDVSLRAEILGYEGHWVEACMLVQPPAACRETVLRSIAAHLPADHDEHAVQLLQRVFEAVMAGSSSPYREALGLVKEVGRRMYPARRAAWLDQLRTQYKAKRNFVRDLPTG